MACLDFVVRACLKSFGSERLSKERAIQTFIPIATTAYSVSAKVLDNKRLNKQALEAWQILMVLTGLDPDGNLRPAKGWANHPATRQWAGYEQALLDYIVAMVAEWQSRGYKSTIADKAVKTYQRAVELGIVKQAEQAEIPAWQADQALFERIATTHRQALLAKDYEHYKQFEWAEDTGTRPEAYEYLWAIDEPKQRTISEVVGDLLTALDEQHQANQPQPIK